MLQIWSSTGTVYNLPLSFEITGDPLERKESTEDIAFADGGQDLSDSRYMQRRIQIRGEIHGDSDSAFQASMDAVRGAFDLFDFKLVVPGLGRYINCKKTTAFEIEFEPGLYLRSGDIQIELLCTDPFWYSIAETILTFADKAGTVAVPDGFTAANGGNVLAYPVLTLGSDANSNDDITLTNTTDDNDAFNYADLAFDNGNSLAIDSTVGSVTKTVGAVESVAIQYFTGRFPRLLPGNNVYEFIGLQTDLTFTFRERWL